MKGEARQALLDIVVQAVDRLQTIAEAHRKLAEINAPLIADQLAFETSVEGERLRRYELTCSRTWLRMFDLLLKARRAGEALDFATIASLDRFVPAGNIDAIDSPASAVTIVVTPAVEPVKEPDPPIEAKSEPENAPNEANSCVQAPSGEREDGHKAVRIDTPHVERKPVAVGITGKTKSHPVLEQVLGGRPATLMNLSPIFGEK